MIIKQLLDEDFVNYKKPSMFIGSSICTWKCEKECGEQVCQNSILASANNIYINDESLVNRYINNSITSAIVVGGLEPLDTWEELYKLITCVRTKTDDDIVIYTGYYKEEIQSYINKLKQFSNIIVKFGRYIPNREKRYDEVLGVYLASDNQYAEKIS